MIMVLVLLVIGGLAAGYLWYSTSKTTGEDAVAEMSESEKEFLEKIETVNNGMNYEQVVEIMGEPDMGVFPIHTWKVNEELGNTAAVHFDKDGAEKLIWVKPNSFSYTKVFTTAEEKELEKEAE